MTLDQLIHHSLSLSNSIFRYKKALDFNGADEPKKDINPNLFNQQGFAVMAESMDDQQVNLSDKDGDEMLVITNAVVEYGPACPTAISKRGSMGVSQEQCRSTKEKTWTLRGIRKSLIWIVMCVGFGSYAQQSSMADFSIERGHTDWVLHGSFTQMALNSAMSKFYPDIDLASVSETEYQSYVVQYISQHLDLRTVGGMGVTPSLNEVAIGVYRTDIRFVLTDLPKNARELYFNISCLMENENHQNVLRLPDIRPGEEFVLSKKNGFKAPIAFYDQRKSFLFDLVVFIVLTISLLLTTYWLLRSRHIQPFNVQV